MLVDWRVGELDRTSNAGVSKIGVHSFFDGEGVCIEDSSKLGSIFGPLILKTSNTGIRALTSSHL